jgi:phytoene dehydrogenase-like protein
VTRILLDGTQVRGVEVQCGLKGKERTATFLADVVVSTAGAGPTYSQLLPPLGLEEQGARAPTRVSSSLVAYLGLRESPEKLGFRGENRWLYEGWDHDATAAATTDALAGRPSHVYLSMQTLKDPKATSHSAQVITAVDPAAFEAWQGTHWRERPQAYEAMKQRVLEGMLALVERRHPGFRALVEYAEVSTPLSVETFTGHHLGGIYGVAGTPERFGDWRHRPPTPIKGLFLGGVDSTALGIVGGLMGGAMAGGAALGFGGFQKVMRAAHRA